MIALSAIASAHPAPALGFHFSEVSIEGNHTADIPGFLSRLKYKTIRTGWATGWDQLSDELDKYGMDQYRVTKAVYYANGWTHIVDPELVLSVNDILPKESHRLKAKIVAWLCETTSASYGFWVYNHGRLLREVLAVDGRVAEHVGTRLRAEKAIRWKDATGNDLFGLVNRLGPRFDPSVDGLKFRIYDLDEHGMN